MKLTLSLCNLITKAARVVTRHYHRELVKYNITPSQGGVIYILNKVGPSTQIEIARLLHLEKTNINAMVKKLVAAGLITIEKDTQDKRKGKLFVTDKGRQLAVILTDIDKEVTANYLKLIKNKDDEKIIRDFLENIVFHLEGAE